MVISTFLKHVALLIQFLFSLFNKNIGIRNISFVFSVLLYLHPSVFHSYPLVYEVRAPSSVLC